ncbi:unnamed protein product [Blepharisma stoltei]|uniref:PPM-type phosphatase domain-containing protein n=1 Tax=Blepharisma stoltei TaxID=1481888 RepID=A0AAU9IFQ5_9CILI|nr:unnamed protein product [Blepharisma stoltei]
MGSCYNKQSRKELQIAPGLIPPPNSNPNVGRQRLSILSAPNSSRTSIEGNLEVLAKLHSGQSRPPTEGKPEQGSLFLVNERYVVESKNEPTKRQESFDEKWSRIVGNKTHTDFLLHLGISVTCKKGLKPESPNQDDYCIVIDGPSFILGVFDGHGFYGHDISNYVHTLLPIIMLSNANWKANPEQVMKESFTQCNQSLINTCNLQDTKFDCEYSGTTATLIHYRDNKLYIAHVGDSRAIIARRKGPTLTPIELTADHKPENLTEKERIEKCGGEVKKQSRDHPFRVYLKGKEYPGLGMSRAIGDAVSQSIGVSCEPELSEYQLDEEDEFLLVCSDGVWEFVGNQEAIDIIDANSRNIKTAPEKLAQLAWERWSAHERGVVDDITVILAYIPKYIQTTVTN